MEEVEKRMRSLGVRLEEVEEKFILGSGSGGQKVNKTSSCVQLQYGGMVIKCQAGRSREDNRYQARVELCDRLQEMKEKIQQAKKDAREKKRRQNRQRSRGQKARMLKDKKHNAMKKRLRGRVDRD